MTLSLLAILFSVAILLIITAIICLLLNQQMLWKELRYQSKEIAKNRRVKRPTAKEADRVIMEILRR